MAGELYGAGAGLLETADQTNTQTQRTQREAESNAQSGAIESGKDIQAMAREKQKEKADKEELDTQISANERMEKLKQAAGYVKVSGSMAMGFAKHTGNPSWLKMAGQEAPWDQITALYTTDMQARAKEGTPKMVQLQEGNDVYHAYVWRDPDTGQMVQVRADKGGAKFNPATGKGKAEADQTRERKSFIDNYDKKSKQLADIEKKLTYSPKDDTLLKQKGTITQELSDDRPKYDQLKGKMAKGGGFSSDEVAAAPKNDEIDAILDGAITGK